MVTVLIGGINMETLNKKEIKRMTIDQNAKKHKEMLEIQSKHKPYCLDFFGIK